MLRDKNTDLANIAKKIITNGADEDFVIKGQGFADIIKSCLGSGNDGLKAKVVELLNNMLVGSDEELKKKSREILKSDVLNTKDILNIFLKNKRYLNKEAISLLSPMCKDEKIKGILSGLIGKDLVEKLGKQGKEVKSDDVVNVFCENVVKGIFSEGNKKHIIDLLKKQDGLHSIDINFDKNGQITEVKREELKVFLKGGKLNLEALKEQAIGDFGRDLKSIKTANGSVINAKGDRKNKKKFLEKIFKDAGISEDAKGLIYKFPGQSAYGTRPFLLAVGAQHSVGVITSFKDHMCSKLNLFGITVNTDGSVEVQVRRIGIINIGTFNLPMVIEEVHTFKINKGKGTYKTTNAKIIVYKLENTSIQLTEENLKKQKVLSEVSYNGDENNNEDNKKE